jgi:hypothetical protein
MNYICRLYATVIKLLPIPVLGHTFLAVDKKRVVYTQKCCSVSKVYGDIDKAWPKHIGNGCTCVVYKNTVA